MFVSAFHNSMVINRFDYLEVQIKKLEASGNSSQFLQSCDLIIYSLLGVSVPPVELTFLVNLPATMRNCLLIK